MSLRCPHCPPACHILYILTEDSSAMYALVARTAPVILATQRGFMAVVVEGFLWPSSYCIIIRPASSAFFLARLLLGGARAKRSHASRSRVIAAFAPFRFSFCLPSLRVHSVQCQVEAALGKETYNSYWFHNAETHLPNYLFMQILRRTC